MVRGINMADIPDVATVALPGATIPDLFEVVRGWVEDPMIRTVSVLIGTNDIGHRSAPGIFEIVSWYRELIDVLCDRFPSARITGINVLPRGDRPELAERIMRFNSLIFDMCSDGFRADRDFGVFGCMRDFLNPWCRCVDRRLFGRGLLHLSANGKAKLVDILNFLINSAQ